MKVWRKKTNNFDETNISFVLCFYMIAANRLSQSLFINSNRHFQFCLL